MRRPAMVCQEVWDEWDLWRKRYYKHGSLNHYYWKVLQRYWRMKKLTATDIDAMIKERRHVMPMVLKNHGPLHHLGNWMFAHRWVNGVMIHDSEFEAAEEMARDTVVHGGVLYQMDAEKPEKESRAYLKTKPTALYRHFDDNDQLLYVGISINPWTRLEAHQKNDWAMKAVRMETEWFDRRPDAAAAEVVAIKTEKPLHNVVHNRAMI